MTEQNQPKQQSRSNPLESIKNEITANLNDKKRSVPWNNIVITAVLGVLTFMSLAQMMASVNIFNKLKGGEVKASTGAPQNDSLDALPDMVGGC